MEKETLLVVDDEREIADLVALYLENEGFQVLKCYSGKDALQCDARERIDLAILDVMLPDVPGGERVDARIYEPLMEMLAAAEAEGLGPIVASGCRTQEKQRSLYEDKIREYRGQGCAKDEAEEVWHYRYVGEEAAREIYEQGLCLEEYLEKSEA